MIHALDDDKKHDPKHGNDAASDVLDDLGVRKKEPRIRCPKCRWRPRKEDRWGCKCEMRRLMGLPIIAKGGKAATNLAPPYNVKSAMALWTPKNAAVKAGARTKTLDVKFSGAGPAAAAKSYKPGAIASWAKSPDKVDKQALEMTVAVGGVTNPSGAPDLKDTHAARWLIDEAGAEQVVGLYPKGTGLERTLDAATNFRTGEKLTELYTVRDAPAPGRCCHRYDCVCCQPLFVRGERSESKGRERRHCGEVRH